MTELSFLGDPFKPNFSNWSLKSQELKMERYSVINTKRTCNLLSEGIFTLCKYDQRRPQLRRMEHDFHKAHCSTYWSFISVKDPTGRIDARMRKRAVRSHPVCYFQKLKDRDSKNRWPTHTIWLRQAEHDDNRQSCLSARHKTLSVCLLAANCEWFLHG